MKRPVMAFLRAAGSALPSFLRRSSAALAVGAVLVIGVGVVTGIIPNVIAALQSQSRAYRDNAKAEEVAAIYAADQAKAAAHQATIHREAQEREAEEIASSTFSGIPVEALKLSVRAAIYEYALDDQSRAALERDFYNVLVIIAALDGKPETLNARDLSQIADGASITIQGNAVKPFPYLGSMLNYYNIPQGDARKEIFNTAAQVDKFPI